MKKNNVFVAPAEDLYLTTELEPGQLPAFLEEAEKVLPTQLTDTIAARHANELLDKLNDEFTTQEAYDAGDSLEMGKSTVMDHLTFCRKNKLIERLARGRYRKL